jgi:glycosyltransferase involved in cell wall biosynthesis
MSKLTFCIIIPVYNEEEIILNVISKALRFIKNTNSKILIINDGSKDNTRKKLDKIKNKKIIVFHKKNEGHGKTIALGYKKAINMKAEYILQIDSDDQISFEEFKKLIKYMNKYDFVVGNRLNRDDPFSRILISGFMKSIIFLLYGKYILDPNCPVRIMKTTFLKEIIKKVSYSTIPNILIAICAKKKNSYKSINIKHIERYTGSSIQFLKLYKTCAIALFDLIRFRLL